MTEIREWIRVRNKSDFEQSVRHTSLPGGRLTWRAGETHTIHKNVYDEVIARQRWAVNVDTEGNPAVEVIAEATPDQIVGADIHSDDAADDQPAATDADAGNPAPETVVEAVKSNTGTYDCPQCTKEFRSKIGLRNHLNAHERKAE